jgi:hypothetical protein
VRAAELGMGVHEMKSYVAQEDVSQWLPLTEWLAQPRRPHVSGSHAPAAASTAAPSTAAAGAAAAGSEPSSLAPRPAEAVDAVDSDQETTQALPAIAAI